MECSISFTGLDEERKLKIFSHDKIELPFFPRAGDTIEIEDYECIVTGSMYHHPHNWASVVLRLKDASELIGREYMMSKGWEVVDA